MRWRVPQDAPPSQHSRWASTQGRSAQPRVPRQAGLHYTDTTDLLPVRSNAISSPLPSKRVG